MLSFLNWCPLKLAMLLGGSNLLSGICNCKYVYYNVMYCNIVFIIDDKKMIELY